VVGTVVRTIVGHVVRLVVGLAVRLVVRSLCGRPNWLDAIRHLSRPVITNNAQLDYILLLLVIGYALTFQLDVQWASQWEPRSASQWASQ
jgi:hypothetical protein